MDGERFVVKKISGAAYEAQSVDETEASLLVGEVDSEHGPEGGSELTFCEFVIGVVLKTEIVDPFYGGDRAEPAGQFKSVGRLYAVAGVESFKPDGLHVGNVRCHVGTEVEKHLLTYALGETVTCAIVDDEAAERGRSARDVFGARHHFDIYAECAGVKSGERYHGGVGYEWYAMAAAQGGECGKVGDLHLRVGYSLEIDATSVFIDSCGNLGGVGEVA